MVCCSRLHSFLAAQERLLGEDGHPRKVQDAEDPHRMGLVLEWVYGTIVSTAEKARDGAKRSLGAPRSLSAVCPCLLPRPAEQVSLYPTVSA